MNQYISVHILYFNGVFNTNYILRELGNQDEFTVFEYCHRPPSDNLIES